MAEVQLSKGKIALVDDDFLPVVLLHKWQYHYKGYAYSDKSLGTINGKTVHKKLWMHHLILEPSSFQLVDHKNGDKLDNRISNLRICDYSKNNANSRLRKDSTSGYKGVSWKDGKWIARLGFNKERLFLGGFNTKIEAAIAYNEAALKHFGEFAKINIIEQEPYAVD